MRPARLLGLRGRLTAAFLLTSAVTLAVAGAALVSPLDHRLRDEELESLVRTARGERRTAERALEERPDRAQLQSLVVSLRRRTGAEVAIVDGAGRALASTDPDARQRFPEAARALREDTAVRAVGSAEGRGQGRVAVPVARGDQQAALDLRKFLDDTRTAAAVVRRALLVAGLVALAVALVLGLVLADRLVRRLAALRATALRVAELGPVVELEPDAARDEVGDLTRAFATMQERLRLQERARRTFVDTASHELRTPLASLRLMLDSLEEELRGRPESLDDAREQARRAGAQAERLSGLASELLELSRIDAGVPLRRELVELDELSRSVVAEFEHVAAERGVALVLDASRPLWAVGDPGAVARIVGVLIDNALRFAPEGSEVVVRVAADGDARVEVCDTGPGVPAADRERIFERFERGSETAGEGGFGLGLAVGRELAARMGGELGLAEEGPGGRFVLRLESAPAP